MQTSLLPKRICDSIDKHCRNFLWGETEGIRKLHLVAWDKICQEKKIGGLGLRHARNVNLSFMSKLGWGLIHKRDELWVQVLRSRYNCGADLIPRVQLKRNCSNIWKGICAAWSNVENNLAWRVGNGHSIDFWKSNWVPNCKQLIDFAHSPVPPHIVDLKFVNFVNHLGQWNWHLISQYLPQWICNVLAGLEPPFEEAGPDSLV